jgi:uncharacterized membrane protein
VEKFNDLLNKWGELTEIFLNALSIICIMVGIVMAITASVENRKRFPGDHPLHTRFRLVFGGWLVVALEFQVAADIVGTIIAPTTQHLVELGVVAVIRTFLNYFLNKELQEERESLHGHERTKTMMVTK